MQVKDALKIVLDRWGIKILDLSWSANIHRTTITRILLGESTSFAWTTLNSIISGLGQINPKSKQMFINLLFELDNPESLDDESDRQPSELTEWSDYDSDC